VDEQGDIHATTLPHPAILRPGYRDARCRPVPCSRGVAAAFYSAAYCRSTQPALLLTTIVTTPAGHSSCDTTRVVAGRTSAFLIAAPPAWRRRAAAVLRIPATALPACYTWFVFPRWRRHAYLLSPATTRSTTRDILYPASGMNRHARVISWWRRSDVKQQRTRDGKGTFERTTGYRCSRPLHCSISTYLSAALHAHPTFRCSPPPKQPTRRLTLSLNIVNAIADVLAWRQRPMRHVLDLIAPGGVGLATFTFSTFQASA